MPWFNYFDVELAIIGGLVVAVMGLLGTLIAAVVAGAQAVGCWMTRAPAPPTHKCPCPSRRVE